MPETAYDVIVAGARCAGASLAAFLARDGARVLALDADRLPSDHVLSTHYIHPPGVRVLDELGVGEAMRKKTPRSRTLRLGVDTIDVDVTLPDGEAAYCPRREHIDGLLQNAAAEAGAEIVDRARVTELQRDGDRVTGVRYTRDGTQHEATATLVVGADGRHSTVAELAGAEEYAAYDAPRAGYWAYWPTSAAWTDPAHTDIDAYMGRRGTDIRYVFYTDNDQILLATAPPADVFDTWRSDHRERYLADLRNDPFIAPLVENNEPDGKIIGIGRERYFFRRGAGPGWALVGDAGHYKDFVLGHGITDALLQAKSLAAAIREGGDAALTRWWRRRDASSVELYRFSEDIALERGVSELDRVVFEHVAKSAELRDRFRQANDRELSPYEVFPTPSVLMWVLGAAARGRWRVLPDFLAQGKRISQVKRELKMRQELARESEAA